MTDSVPWIQTINYSLSLWPTCFASAIVALRVVHRLEHLFRRSGHALCCSHLTSTQLIFKLTTSPTTVLHCGIPQDFILATLLFTLYAIPLGSILTCRWLSGLACIRMLTIINYSFQFEIHNISRLWMYHVRDIFNDICWEMWSATVKLYMPKTTPILWTGYE